MPKKSKKRAGEAGPGESPVARKRLRRRIKITAAAVFALCLIATGFAITRFEPVRRAIGLAPLFAPIAQQPGNLTLSREYIYAGGRLVATEEPTPPGSGPPPTNLLATATQPTSVGLTWATPSSGTIANYVVERAQNKDGPFTQVGTAPQGQLSFTDFTAAADTSYLYRVKATYATGGSSDYSNRDIATTIIFTDASLQGGVIKADHLKEMRRAINAVRALAGLGVAAWTYPDPVSSTGLRRAIYLEDMRELRTNLNPALAALGLAQISEDSTLAKGLPVKAVHIQDVRDQVK
jgi:hypothetical protein